MGNYYEGNLCFCLKNDTPKDILYDLAMISERENNYHTENLKVLNDTKWGKHNRFNYPSYFFERKEYDNYNFYSFEVNFCTKGYLYKNDDLGQDIYDFLKPYIDESVYDMTIGGYIGNVEDEDGTYNKSFFINYDYFNEEVNRRKYLCNENCYYYKNDILCNKYLMCKRAYDLGKNNKK